MKVLIVDDDQLLVEKIAEGMDWNGLGITMIFTANTAWQAREILSKNLIHLIIADVEMPGGSGLELIQWVKEQQMACECIFISSHASFTYAQEAIKLQSSQYLLKPVTNKVLFEEIKKVLDKIRVSSETSLEKLAVKKKRFWTECLESDKQGYWTEELEKQAAKLYKEKERFFVMLVKKLSDPAESGQEEGVLDDYRLQELAERVWRENGGVCESVIYYGDSRRIVIGSGESAQLTFAARRLADGLKAEGWKCSLFFENASTVECAKVFSLVQTLAKVADQAAAEEGACLDIAEWKGRRDAQLEPYFTQWKEQIKAVDELKCLGEEIVICVERECRQARMTKGYLIKIRSVLSQMLFAWLEKQKLQIGTLFDEEEFQRKYENSVRSPDAMKLFVNLLFDKLEGYRHTDTRRESVVKRIEEYIGEHLQEDLSREKLAKAVFLSEGHVSRVFREETGMPLSNYVIMRRMEQAKEYLRSTDWSVSEIAMKVGYSNFSYFGMTFKEYTGCTPNEYRRKM